MSDVLSRLTRLVVQRVSADRLSTIQIVTLCEEIYYSLKEGDAALSNPHSFDSSLDSIEKDKITCLICYKSFEALVRHINTRHGINTDEYRQRFNIPARQSLTCTSLSRRHARSARKSGLVESLERYRKRGEAQV